MTGVRTRDGSLDLALAADLAEVHAGEGEDMNAAVKAADKDLLAAHGHASRVVVLE